MKLIKLMYIIDRKALLRWERPVTYDNYVSMPHGPVLSQTMDLINEGSRPEEPSIWEQCISEPDAYNIRLNQECPPEDLSTAEIELTKEVYEEYGHTPKWELVDRLHKELPEWQDPDGSSIPIHYRDILAKEGRTEQEVSEVEQELDSIARVNQLLGASIFFRVAAL